LAVSWAGTLHKLKLYTFSRALAPEGILPRAKYWQRYCMALQQWGQPNFAAWYKKWNYGTFAESATYIRLGDHHIGH